MNLIWKQTLTWNNFNYRLTVLIQVKRSFERKKERKKDGKQLTGSPKSLSKLDVEEDVKTHRCMHTYATAYNMNSIGATYICASKLS